jgi:hypothetical protein
MPVMHSKEPDPVIAQRVAEDGCILRAVVGSTLHGLSNPGTDDRDEMGVCIEPREYVLGLRRFEHWVFRTQEQGEPSGPGDLDVTIYGLRKYCQLAAKGSPTALLLVFVGGGYIIQRTALGSELQALAPAFVSKRAGAAFLGYFENQCQGLLGGARTTRARERSAAHGYDTKYAMHALRIAHQGIELLTTGRINVPVPEPSRSRLLRVRCGEVPLSELTDELHDETARLESANLTSDLPDDPDYAAINRFLVEAYEHAWGVTKQRS